MNDLFLHDSLDTSPIVSSDRVLYTPTSFAKSALLYLQEIGSLQAEQPHTSSRTHWLEVFLRNFVMHTVLTCIDLWGILAI